MNSFCRISALTCLFWAGTAHALDPLEQSLVDKAIYWQQKGRGDLAAESWKKLLLTDPDQPDALTGMGVYEAQQGHAVESRKYLELLKKAHPGHPGIAKIENAIEAGKVDTGQLNRALMEARRLASQHRYDQALARYRQIFSGSPPRGDLALEYYETLAGTKGGAGEARQGLFELFKSDPGNPRYALAYARQLSYAEGTRREAISMLAGLSENPDVSVEAKAAWRQALIWLNASKPDQVLYHAYLSRFPEDREIRERLARIMKPVPLTPAEKERARAFGELKGGEVGQAEAGFLKTLKKHPNDADAIAGLAIVRLRQQRFGEARELFAKAMKIAPKRAQSWASGYDTASLWDLLGQAKSNPRDAENLLRKALRYDSKEHVAKLALAASLSDADKLQEAEKLYREVLAENSDNQQALGGLAAVLVKEGRKEEALKLASSIGTESARAGVFEAMGDYSRAQVSLENAMLVDPANPWIRLELAKVYRRQGEIPQARSLIDGLLASDPDNPEALYASALLSEEMGQWLDGLNTLERIRQEDRTQAMYDSQRRIWIEAQVERAEIFSRQGSEALAMDALKQAENAAGPSIDLLGIVASGYAKTGRDGMALSMMRKAISASPNPTAGMKLQYAAVLLKTRQDVELGPLLNQLSSGNLPPRERSDLDKIRMGFALRQADLARESGDLARAYDFLSPELSVHPDDPRLQMALARIYHASNDNATALSIYQGVLSRDPGNVDAMLSASGAALDSKDYKTAQSIVDAGLENQPQNPRLLALAGRVARAQGRDDLAMQYFRKALALEAREPAGAGGLRLVGALQPGISPMQGNPFRKPFPAFPQPTDPEQLKVLPSPSAFSAPPPSFQQPLAPASAPAAAKRDEPTLQDELNELSQKYSDTVGAGMSLRNRSGETGMSHLLDFELPVQGEIHTGLSGKFTVTATPISLSAGELNVADPNVAKRFGSNVLGNAVYAGSISQNASGVGLGLAYQYEGLRGDIGFTPISFPKSNLVGGLKLETKPDEDMTFGAELSRRPVTDSMLSYAGAVDPRTGQSWGGVTRNGIGVSFGYDRETMGAYADGGFHRLVGTDVASNNEVDTSFGAYYYAVRQEDEVLTVGANFTAQNYSKDLGFFTLGQGGYFSPQSYFQLGIPVEWSGRSGKLSYQLKTNLGVQSFREDAVSYFPQDGNLQALLQTMAAANPALATSYSGTSVTGFAYLLSGSVEYQLAPKIFLGGAFSLDNATNYNQQIVLGYLRYSFLPQERKLPYPPKLVWPYDLEQIP